MLSGDALFCDSPHVLAQFDRDGASAGRTHPAEHLELNKMSFWRRVAIDRAPSLAGQDAVVRRLSQRAMTEVYSIFTGAP
jgi:hypothetical protein